jgi:hypothetical protein
MNRKLTAVLAAAAALFAIAYIGSPWWAVHQFREAAQSGDRDRLEQTVDFPSVRESFKAQINSMLAEKMASDPEMQNNPFAGLGTMLIPTMVERMVDTVMTPDGFSRLVERGRSERGGPETGGNPKWASGYKSLDRFLVNPKDAAGKKVKPTFVFERRGLFSWKLIRLELPDDLMKQP